MTSNSIATEGSEVKPGLFGMHAGPEQPERSEVLQAMDGFEREGLTVRQLKYERRRLQRVQGLHGSNTPDWYRLLAANALIRSAEIQEQLQKMDQRARKHGRKVNHDQRHRRPAP